MQCSWLPSPLGVTSQQHLERGGHFRNNEISNMFHVREAFALHGSCHWNGLSELSKSSDQVKVVPSLRQFRCWALWEQVPDSKPSDTSCPTLSSSQSFKSTQIYGPIIWSTIGNSSGVHQQEHGDNGILFLSNKRGQTANTFNSTDESQNILIKRSLLVSFCCCNKLPQM